jgi:capsular polysaccharide transport system permease protein
MLAWTKRHQTIMGALIMRELATRYGRNNIGFLWIIAEPIAFAAGVSILWSQIRPPYENGIRLVPFIITGYLPLILMRQMVGFSVNAVKNNNSLLYHRMINPLHLILTRCLIEFFGVSMAAILIITLYNTLGFMGFPTTFVGFLLIYQGWFLLAWVSLGLALCMAALAEIFEFVERFIQIITYIAIPISGAFFMASDMPPKLFRLSMALPLIHCWEMIRRGYFGDSVVTIYNTFHELIWATLLTFSGLIFVQFVRERIEVE